MTRFNRVFSIAVVFILSLFCVGVPFGLADQLDSSSLPGSDGNVWALKDTRIHRGNTSYVYYYADSLIESKVSSYVTQAIAKWGSSVSITKGTASNGNLLISYEYIPRTSVTQHDGTYYTCKSITYPYAGNNIHCNTAEIRINRWWLENNPGGYSSSDWSKLLANTYAHEIGHVYGLDHVSSASSIMYSNASPTKSVTSNDIKGMSVVTHSHVSHSFTQYKQYSNSKHKTICATCKGYKYESHTLSNGNCTKCGYECSHTFGNASYFSTSYHKRTCSKCGYILKEPHIITVNGCTECGYTGPVTDPLNQTPELQFIKPDELIFPSID